MPGAIGGDFWGDIDDDAALRRYQTLVNTIDDGVYQLDADGHFVAVNDVIVETTGYSRDALLGEHVSLVLDDDAVDRIERAIAGQLDSNGSSIAPTELAVHTADGGVVPCELRISLLIENGKFQGTIGVARDRSDKGQQQELAESGQASSESITSVFDEVNIGVIVLDDEFDVAFADLTVSQYFGLDRDALVGRDKRRLLEEKVKHRFDDPERADVPAGERRDVVVSASNVGGDVDRYEVEVEEL